MKLSEKTRVAKESAKAGGRVALDQFRTTVAVDEKSGKNDLVTNVDKQTQNAVVERITETFPDASVVGEEDGTDSTIPGNGTAWVVDPIDGTNNFVRGNRRWTTSVTCLVDGKPVVAVNYLPAMDDLYLGRPDGVWLNDEPVSVSEKTDPERFMVVPTVWWTLDRRDEFAAATEAIVDRFGDLRRIGTAQGALSLLASGRIDGVITNIETDPWDTVGGVAMVRWAGGTATDLAGNDWSHESTGLVVSNGTAHQTVLAAATAIE